MTPKSEVRERYGDISLDWRGHVAVLEMHRPPNNHVDVEMLRALADALRDLDADTRCRAVVLASEGKNFCGGADLAAPRGVASGDGAGINPFYQEAVRVFEARTPMIAAVQGSAVGAGLGLAVACDFRVAADDARFVANFTKLGFHPGFGLSHTLPRLIGVQKTSLMFLTGRRIRAEEALAWGLVDEVAPAENLRAAAIALASEIAANAPLAVVATRATGRAGLAASVKAMTDHEFAEQQRLMQTEDFREGVRSVAERRPGEFKGR
jgi:enoyl-CoA hydratase/carnithine racemase